MVHLFEIFSEKWFVAVYYNLINQIGVTCSLIIGIDKNEKSIYLDPTSFIIELINWENNLTNSKD
mgnify:FL=1|jgi:hypothetical protein